MAIARPWSSLHQNRSGRTVQAHRCGSMVGSPANRRRRRNWRAAAGIMSTLQKIIRRTEIYELAEQRKRRQFAEGVFADWRDHYVASLCARMRLHDEIRRCNGLFPQVQPIAPGEPSREWCNAAVLILTATGNPQLEDRFLRSSLSRKNELVAAVLSDGGLWDVNGFFVELPV